MFLLNREVSRRPTPRLPRVVFAVACLFVFRALLAAQAVPSALESPAAGPPQTGSHGEKLLGMPKFHDPEPYNIDEHTGYKQIFDGKSLTG